MAWDKKQDRAVSQRARMDRRQRLLYQSVDFVDTGMKDALGLSILQTVPRPPAKKADYQVGN